MRNIFRPAKKANIWKEGDEVFADLDALIEEPVSFKLHGKVHVIKPVSSKDFLVFTNNLSKLWDLKEKEKVTPEELVDKYYEMINSLCDSISKEDIKEMTQAQVGALFQLILDSVSGRAQAQAANLIKDAEKKTLMSPQPQH